MGGDAVTTMHPAGGRTTTTKSTIAVTTAASAAAVKRTQIQPNQSQSSVLVGALDFPNANKKILTPPVIKIS